MIKTKTCKRCQSEEPLENFSSNKPTRDGLQSYCKSCNSDIHKRWLSQHREQYKEYQRRWYQENKERLLVKRADCAKTPTERYRQIKGRAKKRGVRLAITREGFIGWFNAQKDDCHYCRRPLTGYENGAPEGLTVDRKDNNRGYELGNLVLACMRCNTMKGSWLTEKQMIEIAHKYLEELI